MRAISVPKLGGARRCSAEKISVIRAFYNSPTELGGVNLGGLEPCKIDGDIKVFADVVKAANLKFEE